MSNWLFIKSFIRKPTKVASIIPSSPQLISKVSRKFDFSQPRVIVEFGPGEGCHTREIIRRMHPQSRLILFELDDALAGYLQRQFADDPRIEVIHDTAANLSNALREREIEHCDYVLSGIPFSILEKNTKRQLLQEVHGCLKPEGKFIIYQVTNELLRHCVEFPHADTDHCLLNIPPMYVIVFHKETPATLNGHATGSNCVNGLNGTHGVNGAKHGDGAKIAP